MVLPFVHSTQPLSTPAGVEQRSWTCCGGSPATTVLMQNYTANATLSWGVAVFMFACILHLCEATLSMPCSPVALLCSCLLTHTARSGGELERSIHMKNDRVREEGMFVLV